MTLKKIKLVFVLFSVVGVAASSCSNDDDDGSSSNTSTNQTKSQVESAVQSGTWKITKFMDSGDDETHHFNGFNFTFKTGGELIADNGNTKYTGAWSISSSNSHDDDDGGTGDVDFNINFNLANEFEDLNDDWDIRSHTGTKIELIDVSGGNGGTDYLTFEKN